MVNDPNPLNVRTIGKWNKSSSGSLPTMKVNLDIAAKRLILETIVEGAMLAYGLDEIAFHTHRGETNSSSKIRRPREFRLLIKSKVVLIKSHD